MCGIAGFVGAGTRADLTRMMEAVAHRGPDDSGYWIEERQRAHLGHRRLSILDLVGGHQPMHSVDGRLVIVFNGEIYNFAELRAELVALGHRFGTDHSDTEVILNGYRQWGADLPRRMNGMWAFAIHDRENRRLFCSRDRFGKKPFFYSCAKGAFAFASELSALRLHPSVDGEISREGLKKYFGYGYIPAPNTILRGARKLPGGHSLWLEIDRLAVRVEKYWEFVIEPFERIPAKPEEEWGAELRSRLETAVRRRLVADVPVGVFLSGGIDSSAVTAFAAQHVPPGALKTFSIGFEEPSFDESAHAARVARLFNTDHRVEVLSIDRAHARLGEIAAKLDEPMGDSSLLPCHLLSEFTRREVKVALGGDAGDELFAGYDPFVALRKAELYSRIVPKPVHEAIRMLAARLPVSHRNMSLDFKLKRTLRGLSHPAWLWLPVWMSPLEPDDFADLFNEPVVLEDVFSEAIAAWNACAQPNPIDRATQYYVRLYLQDDILVKVDRATMMHGLEARAPFLDIDFVDFARRIPAAYRYRNGETKYILKKALEPVLPREVLYRRKKGFGVPIGEWFRDGRLAFHGLNGSAPFNSRAIERKLAEHRAGRRDERAVLWNAWLFEAWQTQAGACPRKSE